MSEPRWTVELDFTPGSTLAECHRQIVQLVRERDAAVRDADTLRQASELADRIRATRHNRWWIGSDRWAQYTNDLRDLLDLLAPPEPGDGP